MNEEKWRVLGGLEMWKKLPRKNEGKRVRRNEKNHKGRLRYHQV
jgi:hypothetical protein